MKRLSDDQKEKISNIMFTVCIILLDIICPIIIGILCGNKGGIVQGFTGEGSLPVIFLTILACMSWGATIAEIILLFKFKRKNKNNKN